MSGACVNDTDTIELLLVGSPDALEANVRNPASTFSGTEGDDTTHVVTDTGVPHIQTHTFNIANTGSAQCKCLVVVTLNPIWAGLPDGPCSLIWEASLTIEGSGVVDQRDTITQGLVENEVVQFCPGVLLGQVTIPAGSDRDVTYEKRITNDGASAQWSFRMGGDKLVATLGY